MEEQNIFDNQTFFDGYRQLRENPVSANDTVEKPALFSLCPDFKDRTVLDLGCGFGENCRKTALEGAKSVTGIDISQKMLETAVSENSFENVRFLHMSMNDMSELDGKFDIILSSLAVHYIQDFDKLLRSVNKLLNDGGLFIFSQEHPLTTALKENNYWTKSEDGSIIHYNLSHYSEQGERSSDWIVQNVIKYHRTFSSIINSLADAGFHTEKVLEPLPDEAVMTEYPSYRKYMHKPDFLLVRSVKTSGML